MSIGIILILAGILIGIFPKLLSLIVTLSFIFLGVSLIYFNYHFKNFFPVIDVERNRKWFF